MRVLTRPDLEYVCRSRRLLMYRPTAVLLYHWTQDNKNYDTLGLLATEQYY